LANDIIKMYPGLFCVRVMIARWFIMQGISRGLAKTKKMGKFNFGDNKNYETHHSGI
jgi:hypothetical protein